MMNMIVMMSLNELSIKSEVILTPTLLNILFFYIISLSFIRGTLRIEQGRGLRPLCRFAGNRCPLLDAQSRQVPDPLGFIVRSGRKKKKMIDDDDDLLDLFK